MVKGFDLRRGRGKAARVRLQGVGGTLLLLPVVDGERDLLGICRRDHADQR